MIFVDTSVFMYAVGRDHPHKLAARKFFIAAKTRGTPLVTSAEVLQEFLHAYLPVGRSESLPGAFTLVAGMSAVWPVEEQDVQLARSLTRRHPGLGARDLLHLASCTRRSVREIKTYDKKLAAAFSR